MWTGRIGLNSAVPPTEYRSALRRVITRESQPWSDPPRPSPHALRVTASHGAVGKSLRHSARLGTSRGEGRARERTDRASTFSHRHHRRTGGGSPHPHRLRLPGRRQGSDSGKGGTTVTIGVDAPLTGDLSALGLGIKNSADLAAKTANKKNYVKGVTFKIEARDDQAQPSAGQQNATALVADKNVLGVVGPLNSSVAESMQKVFDDAKLVEVSPANTGPSLTQGPDWRTKKVRTYKSYFRTATTDAIQGPFAAQYLYNDAKKKKVFVIDDKKTYGAGLAGTFTDEFKKLGGQIVGTEHINPDAKDFSAIATEVKKSGADVVYYGGEYPQAGPLSKQIKAAGSKIPLVGGDGIYDPTFIKLAGATPPATSPPPSAPRSRACPRPSSSSPTTRRPATRTSTRPTAATPTTPPGRSSRPSRRSSTTTAASSPPTPAPRSPRPCRTSPSTV